mgnify:CR=1 FL=1
MPPPELRPFIAESPLHRAPIAEAVSVAAAAMAPGTRVLDAGAGEAPYRPLFAHCEYVTQDWPGTVHAGARDADVIADLHDLPVADGSFDAVVCTEVLEHVAEPARVLDELARVLRPGGTVLITVPFVGGLHEEPHDHYRYTSHGLAGLLDRAGFTNIEVEPLTGYWSTLSQVLRQATMNTTPIDVAPRPLTRLAGGVTYVLSEVLRRVAPALDRRLDHRRALPIGWVARATAPGPALQPSD